MINAYLSYKNDNYDSLLYCLNLKDINVDMASNSLVWELGHCTLGLFTC